MNFFKRHYGKLLLGVSLYAMIAWPTYFWGTIGILIALLIAVLFIIELVLDIYIVWAYLVEWYRERGDRKR